MLLTELQVRGFRSLEDVQVSFDRLTVLIGENDSGKSSVLDVLALCLSNSRPDSSDFYCDDEQKAVDEITSVLAFCLDEEDEQAIPYAMGNLHLTRVVL